MRTERVTPASQERGHLDQQNHFNQKQISIQIEHLLEMHKACIPNSTFTSFEITGRKGNGLGGFD